MNKIEKYFDERSNAARREAGAPFYTVGQMRKKEQWVMRGIFYFLIISLLVIVFGAAVKAHADVLLFDTEQGSTVSGDGSGGFTFSRFGIPNNSTGPSAEGQTVEVVTSGTLGYIEAYIDKRDDPTGNVIIEVHDITCDGSLLASGQIDNGELTNSMALYQIVLDTPFAVTAADVLCVTFDADALDSSNWFNIAGQGSGTYADGTIARFGDGGAMFWDPNGGDVQVAGYEGEIIVDPDPDPETDMSLGGATSTINQTQQNLAWSFVFFFCALFFITWFFKRRL